MPNGPSTDPSSHDFDWVAARRRCTFKCKEQVDIFREAVRMSVERRIKDITSEDERRGALLDFDDTEVVENVDAAFKVRKKSFPDYGGYDAMVLFEVVADRIEVFLSIPPRGEAPKLIFEVRMILTKDGKERYQTSNIKRLDLEGVFLRWQVIRIALEPLFFS